MNKTTRSPWWGLSGAQLTQIDEDLRAPWRVDLPQGRRYADLADEYARRGMALLAANDLRGAMWFSDLYGHCAGRATGEEYRQAIHQGRGVVAENPAAAERVAEDPTPFHAEAPKVVQRGAAGRLTHTIDRMGAA